MLTRQFKFKSKHTALSVTALSATAALAAGFSFTAYAHQPANNAPIIAASTSHTHNKADNSTEFKARGVLVAGQSANIAAGMSGRLLKAPYKQGQYVKSGAILAQFDCAQLTAQLASRKAAYATQSLRYDNQNELLALGAAGEIDVSIALSEREEIKADIRAIEVTMRDCKITAPFSGYITQRHVNAHETPQAGQPLYSFMRAGSSELSVITPSHWAKWLKPGQSLSFVIDETGETVSAKVLRLSAEVDPVSQTLEITAKPVGKFKARPGMSGVARFTPPALTTQ